MKYKLIYIVSLLLLFSCKNDKKNQLETTEVNETIHSENIQLKEDDYGLWSGLFEVDSADFQQSESFSYLNRIGFVIQNITNDDVIGYTVTAGNLRPFTGSIKNTDSTRYVVVNEPGDHKYDGTFMFNISPNNDSIYGKWISKRKDLPVYSRVFNLKKKEFKYNPKEMLIQNKYQDEDGKEVGEPLIDWINYKEKKEKFDGEEYGLAVHRSASDEIYIINASTQKLTEKNLKNLRKLDLEIIRNTIYARHGFSFSNQGVRQFFDQVDWYIPLYVNVEDKLTSIEKDNIALLKRLEEYAEDHYQQYGR